MTSRLAAVQRLVATAAYLGFTAAGRTDELVSAALMFDDSLRRGWDEQSLALVAEQHATLDTLPPTRVLLVPQRWPDDGAPEDVPVPVAVVIDLATERAVADV